MRAADAGTPAPAKHRRDSGARKLSGQQLVEFRELSLQPCDEFFGGISVTGFVVLVRAHPVAQIREFLLNVFFLLLPFLADQIGAAIHVADPMTVLPSDTWPDVSRFQVLAVVERQRGPVKL